MIFDKSSNEKQLHCCARSKVTSRAIYCGHGVSLVRGRPRTSSSLILDRYPYSAEDGVALHLAW